MLFNWKLKILSSVVAVAMLFTVCPSITFAAKTYLHEVLEDRNHAPSVDELKRMVDLHPEWLSERDDRGRTPLDIARENDLSNAVALLTVSTPSRDDQLSDFFTSFSHVPVKIAALETQDEELKKQIKSFQAEIADLRSLLTAVAKTMPQEVEIGKKISALETQNEELKRQIKSLQAETGTILSSAYPVGSIYMSINSTDPSTLFGGTWVRWGNGRVPVGVDTTQTEFNTVEKTGGEKAHILTVSEIPNHNHTTGIQGNSAGNMMSGSSSAQVLYNQSAGVKTTSTGEDQAHNNLQPYITCYMWKRTA